MIITLVKADFSVNNIGTLGSFAVLTNLGLGCTYSGPTSVATGEALSATITIADGYILSSSTITMGGNALSDEVVVENNVITLNIAEVTGMIIIIIVTALDETVSETPVETYAFPLRNVGLGVTSEGTGRVSSTSTRLSNASTTEYLGILVPADNTITLYGLASGTYPLRFDYIYGTVNATNPESGSTTAIEGLLGTASNYVSADYFPCNVDGNDSYSVKNTYGQDCYFWFAFAGLNKTEKITAEIDTYNITYTITPPITINDEDWLDLPVTSKALGVTSSGTGRVSNTTTRFSTADDTTANGILIPSGKTIYFKGLTSGTYPLRFDYVYGTMNVANPVSGSTTAIEGLVGTASNYVSADYFPLNTEGSDTYEVINSYGADYYFWFGFAGLTKAELIQAEVDTYDIKYFIA